jgi:hypothetical protein
MASGSSGNGTGPSKASDPPKPLFAGFKVSVFFLRSKFYFDFNKDLKGWKSYYQEVIA